MIEYYLTELSEFGSDASAANRRQDVFFESRRIPAFPKSKIFCLSFERYNDLFSLLYPFSLYSSANIPN